MSHAGRRLSARLGATLSALTLAAAFAVPLRLADAAQATARTDQIRARQWHLAALRVPRVWRTSKGGGVTVAVLDTGVDRRHPDLVGRVSSGPDLTGGVRRPGSRYWGLHGTSMASIIAGHGHGTGGEQGVIGVAPQSRILSVRVTWENDDPLRQSGGQIGRNRDAVAQGIRFAVDNGADIINMSLGGGKLFYDGSSTEEDAIRYAVSRGVVLIASAGNDGSGANRKNFPAAYPGVIAVGAVDRRMRIWRDSNRHSYVAVCAPGVDIVSADASSGYVVGTGTSPSSAIVAGVAALIRARYPTLTPQEVRQALVQGSVPRRQADGVNTCDTTLDAARAMTVASRISRSSQDQSPEPTQAAGPVQPDSVSEEAGPGLLLPAILVGGGVLVAGGVLLGWTQRRRPEEDEPDDDLEDDSPYDVLRPKYPPQPFGASAAGDPSGIGAAPVNAPLWQSNEVFPGGQPPMTHRPPSPSPSPPPSPPSFPPPPPSARPDFLHSPMADEGDPVAAASASQGVPFSAPVPEHEPKHEYEPQWQLRPFVPEEFLGNGNGHGNGQENGHGNGHGRVNGVNGSGTAHAEPPEGHRINGLNGFHGKANGVNPYEQPSSQAGEPVIDDDEWERFRRSVLDDAPYPGDLPPAVAFPSAPPPDLDDADAPPGTFSPPPGITPTDDGPLGGSPRRQWPNDEDDYRPPWW